ncbi:MAG: hypothetical protein Q8R30_02820 [bacterium]|nr:hypothetical protein [bacterium]MDZ4285703.1 hypothetical protein [Candidatus Sungbacteria bacterium]
MTTIRLIIAYIGWHFGKGLRELFQLWKNLSWFGYHFFSIPLLLRTLIRPLFRIHESAPAGTGLNLELFFENLTINLIARITGFFLRIFLIICGAVYQICILFLAPILFLGWLIIPILPLVLIIIGIQMAF